MKQTLPELLTGKIKAIVSKIDEVYKSLTHVPVARKGLGIGFLFLLLPLPTLAQLQDNFSDGNFTQNPVWSGDSGGFIVNSQKQLQSNGPAVTGTTLQLTTPSKAIVGTTWEFWTNLKMATSATNYTDIYLISDKENLTAADVNGYFVRIGNTADEVSLYRKDAGKTAVMIINGQDNTIGSADNVVRVRVTRTINYEWELSIDVTGTGQNFVSQGAATDAVHKSAGYFGVLVKYTSANSKNFYFDDFIVTDTQPPALSQLQTITQQELILHFNEPLQPEQVQTIANYTLNGSIKPTIAELQNQNKVRLVFSQNFRSGSNILTIVNLQDLYGNTITTPIQSSFSFVPPAVTPNYNELLITELMADETPAVGLPAQEYIELYNPTPAVLNLQGIRLSDATSTTTLPNTQLLPGEYAVVVPNAQVAAFTKYGKVIGISNFPGLNNAGELLQLRRPDGKLIYAVNYSDAWYKNAAKRDGGWSLEMIDVTNPCAGIENWTASTHPDGGTPANPNAVTGSVPDNTPPTIVNATAVSPTQVLIRFSEQLDSAQAATIANYSLNPTIAVTNVQVQSPLFTEIIVTLGSPLQEKQLYTIAITGITDCSGNLPAQPLTATFALPSFPITGDIVINEVLFNPRPNGVDFVELVNRSDKYIDLKNWQLGNTSGDTISSLKTITTATYVLAPGQLVVLTSNPENIKTNYPAANEKAFLKMSSLPSYPDDAGTIVVLQADKRVADRFSYSADMHFALLDDVNGVSLERIRLDGPTIASNFHSAATTVFATPGYKNSQTQEGVQAKQIFKVEPQVFSPDGDGLADFTTINYTTSKTGFVATITIFDAQGREVRKLVRNELLADNGFFRWDGQKQDGSKAGIGYYVFYIELFGMNGEKSEYKEKVVVSGRL